MMAVRVQCPFCTKALRFRQPPATGRRLLCTGCNRSFPVQPGMIVPIEIKPAAPAPTPVAVSTPTPLPASVLTPVAPPLPQSVAEADPPMTAARRNMILAGVAIGLVFLVGTTAIALALASRHDRGKAREPIADRT